jgi:hypothetical protein
MKKLQQLFAAVILTLLLSLSTFAGDGVIITMNTEPPPPSSSAETNDASAEEGIISTGVADTDSATLFALNLLQSVLALF